MKLFFFLGHSGLQNHWTSLLLSFL
jgi:hypothetical protein